MGNHNFLKIVYVIQFNYYDYYAHATTHSTLYSENDDADLHLIISTK